MLARNVMWSAAGLVLLAALAAPASAQHINVGFSYRDGGRHRVPPPRYVHHRPPPRYCAPAPVVYYRPAPVVVRRPVVVYERPVVVYERPSYAYQRYEYRSYRDCDDGYARYSDRGYIEPRYDRGSSVGVSFYYGRR